MAVLIGGTTPNLFIDKYLDAVVARLQKRAGLGAGLFVDVILSRIVLEFGPTSKYSFYSNRCGRIAVKTVSGKSYSHPDFGVAVVFDERPMHLCFVDESGCLGHLPNATSEIQPLFAIVGLILDHARIHDLTLRWLYLKRDFFPDAVLRDGSRPGQFLDWMLFEPKGGDLRRSAAETSKRKRRHAIRFLDQTLKLVEGAGGRLVGRVWVKGIGRPVNGTAVYTSAIQHLSAYFDAFLRRQDDQGFLIADSRSKDRNAKVAHSIFTQRFSSRGNPYSHLLELPVFGHSDNHAGLQVADLLCSGIIFPMAVHSFCAGHVTSVHVRPGYQRLKDEFAERVKNLQHRFLTAEGKWSGGIVCSDAIAQRPGRLLFEV